MTSPSRSVCLFGTDEPVEPTKLLAAGPLSAEIEAGNLRYISWNDAEMIRAISFVVRDRDWGTYPVEISDLAVEMRPDHFRVTSKAIAGDAAQRFSYAAEIVGDAGGELSFHCRGVADTAFVTNRTGFVVLHPIEGVAGEPATLEHVDDSIEATRFPLAIDPVQPFRDLRAITHSFSPGASVTCYMEGDVYETEDQRNWTDASYKTYVRPLALPWPYEIARSATLDQRVALRVHPGPTKASMPVGGPAAARLTLADPLPYAVPPIGVALDPDHIEAAEASIPLLRQAGLAHLLCHHDPRRGHDGRSLRRAATIAGDIGASPWLEFVVPGVGDFEKDVAELGRIVADLGAPFTTVLLSPAADLKSTLPGSEWPDAPPLDALHRAARIAFPGVRIGGGMFSYFTELNRKRPPLDALDLVTFSTCPLVHAGDDRSVIEALEAIQHVALSARVIAGDKPLHVGPSSIGMRLNPYGTAPKDNPHNIRQAMNGTDPRQRGLFAAAWNLGYLAGFASEGISALSLGAAAGPQGLVHASADAPKPYFDAAGGNRNLYPVFHVIRGVARLSGRPMLAVDLNGCESLRALACETERGREIWVANCSADIQRIDLGGLGGRKLSIAHLDAGNFTTASGTPTVLDTLSPVTDGSPVEIDAYGVLRIVQITARLS